MQSNITPVPQTAPISDMRRRQDEILAMVQNAPVILMTRSQPAGVLVSVEQWDAMAVELRNARLMAERRQILAETSEEDWFTIEEIDRELEEKRKELTKQGETDVAS